MFIYSLFFVCPFVGSLASAIPQSSITPNVQPFKINLSGEVPRMRELVRNTKLPEEPVYPGVGSTFGIDLDVLKSMREQWLTDYDWEKDEKYLNSFKHYNTTIEGLNIHFIHETSDDPDAIPILLLHGWPGSFLEFLPMVKNLTTRAVLPNGKIASFNVIVPSLPGFAFSSAAPMNWTIEDTTRVFDSLMHNVLNYTKYAVHGTDWGSGLAYDMYETYTTRVRASHFVFLPFYPLDEAGLAARNITLSPSEKLEEERFLNWASKGNGYFVELSTEPNTIGFALYDSPVGQLAFIGQKFIIWSDPRQGTYPSVLTHNEILRSVTLYFLTRSFVSSGFMYAQNLNGFKQTYTKANTDAPMLYSTFSYNVGFWPQPLVAEVGNLVSYKNHDFGGHFPGLDNPVALVDDLREIKNYWK